MVSLNLEVVNISQAMNKDEEKLFKMPLREFYALYATYSEYLRLRKEEQKRS